MKLTLHGNQIWIGREAVDFRKAIDGLYSYILVVLVRGGIFHHTFAISCMVPSQ